MPVLWKFSSAPYSFIMFNKVSNASDVMAPDGRTDGHGQTYTPSPSAGDIKVCETRIPNLEVQEAAQND